MTVSTDNKAIKIPEQHYVGFNKRAEDDIPLGFMTPDGEDAAAIKRKATVDDWAKRNYYGSKDIKLPAATYQNKPLSGFKFGSSVRHGGGWGQGNVKWRIEDPRGFELEISSPNLQQIMEISTIEKGEILEKCVWGRLGSENILIPISSEVYQTALTNTARLNSSASLKDLEIGYNIVLQNGIEGRYLGAHYEIEHSNLEVKQGSKKKHFIETTTDKGMIKYETISTLKPSSISEGPKLSVEDAERLINDTLANGKADKGYRNWRVTCKPMKDLQYFVRPGSPSDKTSFENVLLVQNPHDATRFGFVSTYYFEHNYYRNEVQATQIDLNKLLTENSLATFTQMEGSSWHRYERTATFSVDPTDTGLAWQTVGYTIRVGSGDTIEVIL